MVVGFEVFEADSESLEKGSLMVIRRRRRMWARLGVRKHRWL